jgi:hypothetical protein
MLGNIDCSVGTVGLGVEKLSNNTKYPVPDKCDHPLRGRAEVRSRIVRCTVCGRPARLIRRSCFAFVASGSLILRLQGLSRLAHIVRMAQSV